MAISEFNGLTNATIMKKVFLFVIMFLFYSFSRSRLIAMAVFLLGEVNAFCHFLDFRKKKRNDFAQHQMQLSMKINQAIGPRSNK